MEGSQTDRGRIYIVYGPPDEISMEPFFKRHYGEDKYFLGPVNPFNNSFIKSYSIWIYYRPAGNRVSKSFGFRFQSMTFIFADIHGFGSYELLFSTEDNELSDSRTNQF